MCFQHKLPEVLHLPINLHVEPTGCASKRASVLGCAVVAGPCLILGGPPLVELCNLFCIGIQIRGHTKPMLRTYAS